MVTESKMDQNSIIKDSDGNVIEPCISCKYLHTYTGYNVNNFQGDITPLHYICTSENYCSRKMLYVMEHIEENVAEKPPLGTAPAHIVYEDRILELAGAIGRYATYDEPDTIHKIADWAREIVTLSDLIDAVRKKNNS